jgi:hypothetical protein
MSGFARRRGDAEFFDYITPRLCVSARVFAFWFYPVNGGMAVAGGKRSIIPLP